MQDKLFSGGGCVSSGGLPRVVRVACHACGVSLLRMVSKRWSCAKETGRVFSGIFRSERWGGNAVWNVNISLSSCLTEDYGFPFRFFERTDRLEKNTRF